MASWRRRWYAGAAARRRRLPHPVVSVGNLCVGGSGKTPVVAHLARWLMVRGERPVILSRGYARQAADAPVTIVSDRGGVKAPLARAGDEPLWLARALPGVPVVVGADRYRAGLVASAECDPTIFLLDDGFQHLGLARDLDLLLVSDEDLRDRPLPTGRLREPLSAARCADIVVASSRGADAPARLSAALGVPVPFRVVRDIGDAVRLAGGQAVAPSGAERALAVAGIARPECFFDDLARAGWPVLERLAFADHHPFSASDMNRIAERARAVDATIVLTTEKDAVRLEGLAEAALPFAQVPLRVAIEPSGEFDDWLEGRLRAIRGVAAGRSPVPEGRR